MYAKKWYERATKKDRFIQFLIVFVGLIIAAAIGLLSTGCKTAGTITDGAILEYKDRITELQNENTRITGIIDTSRETVDGLIGEISYIRERARSIVDSIERVEFLFSEYERITIELIQAYRAIQNEVKSGN
jgi:hypothetical protein